MPSSLFEHTRGSVNVENNRIKLLTSYTHFKHIIQLLLALELYITWTVGTIHANNNILLKNESRGHPFFDSAKEGKFIRNLRVRTVTPAPSFDHSRNGIILEIMIKPQFSNISDLKQFGSLPSCSWKKCLNCQTKLQF